jgi:HAD superfamily phosphoserine phosphatase-like hydrolase
MASILFDCDSTLLKIESLEALLDPLLDEEQQGAFQAITSSGMNGDMPFFSSLENRLQLASPHLDDVAAFNETISTYITEDAEDLIVYLLEQGHQVYLVSGGMVEVVKALGDHLGVHEDQVYAVSLLWDEEGRFHAVDPEDMMSHSKEEGLREVHQDFEHPVIAVGDGMTDARLKDAGIADIFIAYTEHEQRDSVVDKADYVAEDMEELGDILEELIC